MDRVERLRDLLGRLEVLHLQLRECLMAPGWPRLDQCLLALENGQHELMALMQALQTADGTVPGVAQADQNHLRDKINQIQQLHTINQELLYLSMERVEHMMAAHPGLNSRARYGRAGRWLQDPPRHLLTQG